MFSILIKLTSIVINKYLLLLNKGIQYIMNASEEISIDDDRNRTKNKTAETRMIQLIRE